MDVPVDGERSNFGAVRVPLFDGEQKNYREYRKKLEFFVARKKLKKEEETTALDIAQSLTGQAWELMEDLTAE